jgi:26S proteasome non-ATPase regulatory subunit 9
MADQRAALKALMAQKDAIEQEIIDISEALSADNMGGATGALVDGEGYPRADVDIHTTRTLRNKLASLNFDHQSIMKKIEAGLIGALPPPSERQPTGTTPASVGASPPRPLPSTASAAASGTDAAAALNTAAAASASASANAANAAACRAAAASAASTRAAAAANAAAAGPTGATPFPPAQPSTGPSPMEVVDIADGGNEGDLALEAFAEIDEVFPESPAASAGVAVGDRLLRFGGVDASNHDGLRALARLVQRSVGESLPLLVLRGDTQRVRLELVPRRWSGQGLLGCHLRPML